MSGNVPRNGREINLPPTRHVEESVRQTGQWIKQALKALIKAGWEIRYQYEASGNNTQLDSLINVIKQAIVLVELLAQCYDIDTEQLRKGAIKNLPKARSLPSRITKPSSAPPLDHETINSFCELLKPFDETHVLRVDPCERTMAANTPMNPGKCLRRGVDFKSPTDPPSTKKIPYLKSFTTKDLEKTVDISPEKLRNLRRRKHRGNAP